MGQDEAVMGISRDTRILKYYIFYMLLVAVL